MPSLLRRAAQVVPRPPAQPVLSSVLRSGLDLAGSRAAQAIDGDDFTRRIVSVAFLVRLLSLLAGLLGWESREVDGPVLALVVLLGLTSYLGTARRGLLPQAVLRHPALAMADVLLVLLVVGVAGPDSPLVLTTYSTALVVGVLFAPRVAAVLGVVLVAGYTLVRQSDDATVEAGFSVAYGTPLLYLGLLGVGAAVRSVHHEQVEVMRALATSQALRSGAEERARLAREMHDSLAKTLHGIALGASALPTWAHRDPERAGALARQLAQDAETAASEARSLLDRMRADQPDRPLAQVLGDRCRALGDEHALVCDFSADDLVDVSSDVRYELCAIVDEALRNVVRHADASHLSLTLTRAGDEVVVLVQDNGRGFTPCADGAGPPGRHGLRGMRERAEVAGGRLDVQTAPDEGTLVTLRLPTVPA